MAFLFGLVTKRFRAKKTTRLEAHAAPLVVMSSVSNLVCLPRPCLRKVKALKRKAEEEDPDAEGVKPKGKAKAEPKLKGKAKAKGKTRKAKAEEGSEEGE